MQPGDKDSQATHPKSSVVLTPGSVGVICVAVIALVLVFKFLPDTKAPAAPAVPAYPDLSPRVTELEQQLAAAKAAPPAWPDLSDKVAAQDATLAVLQGQLAEAQAAPEYLMLRNRIAALESEVEATRDALAAARRGNVEAQLRLERDDLAARTDQLTREVTQLRDDRARMQKLLAATGQQMRRTSAEKTAPGEHEAALAALTEELQTARSALAGAQDDASRAHDALAALQRASTRNEAETSAHHAQLDRLRDANDRLTSDNQRLRATLARPVGANPVATTPPPGFSPRMHVIAAGDTLSNLSQRYYGSAARWPEIYQANSDLLGPTGILRIGTTLRIP